MRVAVVGAGIVGSSAARFLAERGHSVTLFEQFPAGHGLGSSHGASRIVRRAYPDRAFTEIMGEAYPLWHELEAASGETLLHEVGLLYFGADASAEMVAVREGLTDLGVPHQVLAPSEAAAKRPGLKLAPDEVAIWTPEAGYVDASLAVRTTLDLALAAGAEWVREKADRERVESYDRFVVAPGGWIGDWVELPATTTLQTYAYFEGRAEGPVWIEDSGDFLYGFPSYPGAHRFKAALHRPGPELDPSDDGREPVEADLARIEERLARRFGMQPRCVEAAGCVYTTLPDDQFAFGRIGDRGAYASACSGHGFKFGPWSGRKLARMILEDA